MLSKKTCAAPVWVVLVTLASLAAGNFVFQGVFADAPNWMVAIDRSWFQATALFVAWLTWGCPTVNC